LTTFVYRPILPRSSAIAKYIDQLDGSRQYTNHGPLSDDLEARLAARFGLLPAQVLLASSGTAALTGAILGTAGRAKPARPLCLAPAYTFVAGVLAAIQCGYRPCLLDVERSTWSVSPEAVLAHPQVRQAGLILVAAPYGRAAEWEAWDRVGEQAGAAVVIDAAASADALADGRQLLARTPAIISFHATKAFSCGEGGAILCPDSSLRSCSWAALNFGFDDARETSASGFNGKMSEYHAAVGLAELDGWDKKRRALAEVASAYRRSAARWNVRIHVAPEIAPNYVLFEAPEASKAAAVKKALAARQVETRFWYGMGLHREPYFRDVPHEPLPNVDHLSSCLLGLPTAHDLASEEVEEIVQVTAQA